MTELERIQRALAKFRRQKEPLKKLAAKLDSLEDYHVEQVWDRYWGLKAHQALAVFDRVYDKLVAVGATYRDRLVWGDIDCGAWVEPHAEKKIVCVEVYCAARDDNTYLYIGPKEDHGEWMFRYLHGRTCWPRQKLWQYGINAWGHKDWRSVTRPSIQTYRRFDFEPGYRDSRDDGYGFSLRYLDDDDPRVEGSLYHAGEISGTLKQLGWIEDGFVDPYQVPGGKT